MDEVVRILKDSRVSFILFGTARAVIQMFSHRVVSIDVRKVVVYRNRIFNYAVALVTMTGLYSSRPDGARCR
jgi:hypothetical protein